MPEFLSKDGREPVPLGRARDAGDLPTRVQTLG